MNVRSLIKILTNTSGFLLLTMTAFAQTDRGTITGTIADQQSSFIPNAIVIAINMETGVKYETVSTSTGNYMLASLPVGTYELSVEASGFKKHLQKDISVKLLQTSRIDVVLQVGAASESVTVTAQAPLLKSENAEQNTNISGELFNALPMNFGGGGGNTGSIRNWLSFIQLSPGVSGTTERAAVNGANGGGFKIYLEGQDVTSSNDTVWTSTVAAASVETIGEFSVQTSNFAAEFGQVLGGDQVRHE